MDHIIAFDQLAGLGQCLVVYLVELPAVQTAALMARLYLFYEHFHAG